MKIKKRVVRKKSKIIPIGTNADYAVDNIITLHRSSNDVFEGVIDYMFYKIINCTPIECINISKYEFEYPEEELNEMEENFKQYDLKYDKEISKTLKKQIDTAIILIREIALAEEVIEEVVKGKYCEVGNSFNQLYIIGKIIELYKEGVLC
ncbi:MAG: hypothetical protein ACRCX2_09445 [Paraclostridium sp.]